MEIECGCGAKYDDSKAKCPSCDEEMDPKEKAEKSAKAGFEAAMPSPPVPGAPLPAARVGDPTLCPAVTVLVPHVGGPITGPGVPTVLVGGMPAAVLGDMITEAGPPSTIIKGSAKLLIGGRPAARMFDNHAHGGMIILGCPLVLIGG